MKCAVYLFALIMIFSCTPKQKDAEVSDSTPNRVLVMGMIHSGHLTSEVYGIPQLKALFRTIDPDVILTEIPPDRFDAAVKGFEENDSISEPRVLRFPEYVDVMFPLTKEMDFDIVPTAGWTREMADARTKRMREISEDPEWEERWQLYREARVRSDSAGYGRDDPYWIHTDAYDDAAEIGLSVYNDLLNDELGPGGWDNINAAHYGHIANALDSLEGQGKLVLITYGAGHKGWFMRQLRQRDDIKLLDMKPYLDEALGE